VRSPTNWLVETGSTCIAVLLLLCMLSEGHK
jgi:hypothetical protein